MSKKSEKKHLKCVAKCNLTFSKSLKKHQASLKKKRLKSLKKKMRYGGYKKLKRSLKNNTKKRKTRRSSKRKSNKKQKGRGYALGSKKCSFTQGSYPCVSKYSDC